MERLQLATGRQLRRARVAAGLTLHDVRVLSNSRFKPSSVGAYERAERLISLARFVDLAKIYGVPPDRLLARVLEDMEKEPSETIVLDPTPEISNHVAARSD